MAQIVHSQILRQPSPGDGGSEDLLQELALAQHAAPGHGDQHVVAAQRPAGQVRADLTQPPGQADRPPLVGLGRPQVGLPSTSATTLQANWSNIWSGTQVASYAIDPNGIVRIRGTVTGPSGGELIFVLRLQPFYLPQGFTYIRTVVLAHNRSGALFRRPAQRVPTPQLHEAEALDMPGRTP